MALNTFQARAVEIVLRDLQEDHEDIKTLLAAGDYTIARSCFEQLTQSIANMRAGQMVITPELEQKMLDACALSTRFQDLSGEARDFQEFQEFKKFQRFQRFQEFQEFQKLNAAAAPVPAQARPRWPAVPARVAAPAPARASIELLDEEPLARAPARAPARARVAPSAPHPAELLDEEEQIARAVAESLRTDAAENEERGREAAVRLQSEEDAESESESDAASDAASVGSADAESVGSADEDDAAWQERIQREAADRDHY